MSLGIYLSAKNDKEGFRLPINPEKVEVVGSGDGESYTIATLGNINIPKDAKLEEYSIASFFPAQESIYSVSVFLEPQYYIDLINNWKKAKLPIRYIYVNGSFTINELVTIEKFNYDETGGCSDVNFTLDLKKHVPFGPKKMVIVKQKVVKKSGPKRANKKDIPQTYSLIKGDSLWKVAQKYTKNGANYKELQKLNGIKDSQLRKLPIGLKLKIPPSWIKN
ncbi:LysM peptidoglycan-binding domain-containing protein [Cytobacillus praedii]|uniref:LysM peptidoglycan-binding domain-containing protein n=1 Tax=Cytobacillus praedii TaxID=1742358 RepID=A0A4R1AVI1_9BACI|nr:LysM peptidoglycan-binding domain-containing protein [Cytobacillus praedii]TCJ01489.1 LysM peptidoglycan-binding domain-containing protein [Cytobacillus praedii]